MACFCWNCSCFNAPDTVCDVEKWKLWCLRNGNFTGRRNDDDVDEADEDRVNLPLSRLWAARVSGNNSFGTRICLRRLDDVNGLVGMNLYTSGENGRSIA